MTERAQALEDAIEKARQGLIGFAAEIHDGRVPVVGAVRDHLVLNLGLIASFLADALEGSQPPPPVGSPTTGHVAPIVGKVWTHHDGVLPDGSVCRTADVDALIAERTAQLQAALFDEQAAHEATKCRLVAAEQSHEAAGNRVIELLKSTPVEPAGTPTLQDALSALRYIRETHGALYGVGWDRLLPVEPAGASHTGWGPDKTRDCHCTACQGEPAGASEPPSDREGVNPQPDEHAALEEARKTIHIMRLAAPPEDEIQNQIDVMHRRLATERLGEGGITVPQMGQLLLACSQRMAADWGRVGALERERNQLSAKLSTVEATITTLTAQWVKLADNHAKERHAGNDELTTLRAERDRLRTAAIALRDAMTASADPQDSYPALHTLLALVQEP